jgi:hypothetical protein
VRAADQSVTRQEELSRRDDRRGIGISFSGSLGSLWRLFGSHLEIQKRFHAFRSLHQRPGNVLPVPLHTRQTDFRGPFSR